MAMRLMTLLAVTGVFCMVESTQSAHADLYPEVREYVIQRAAEFDEIPAERKLLLEQLTEFIRQRASKEHPAQLTFVCTHNSRRSHLSQIWTQIAATHYGIEYVKTYSGGTEVTAFNPRTVAALERCGVKFSVAEESKTNPHYSVAFSDTETPLICFSKIFNLPPNPTKDYCAVMTCSHADRNCPLASGCDERIAIPYEDPKVADNTALEVATYDERCAQIAREMVYMMSKVKR
jgi:arsenate reductase